ncbi:hypothetical protein C0W42_11650 [Photobacterium kishitanii]|uniref:hypothetical protein n=1 Tax=Photobacterium kishitanii TaxID=318456 RepID=UPI000D174EDC|nr:hypothetical protein [Photobacterium kishitanii]PSU88979.1 hypothetical protein C0W42_11650 [Photobacterium kishitanii]
MTYLLAYTGSRSGGLQKVLTSDDSIFDIPNLDNTYAYSPATNLDNDEWFIIENFSDSGYPNAFVSRVSPLNTTSLNQLPVDKYCKIKYLCSEQGDYKLFQKFVPSQLISKRWFSIEEPQLRTDKKIICFSGVPDAVYNMVEDKLYFRDIAKVKAIFKGMEVLYREATETEVGEFLATEFIELAENYTVNSVKVPNRKRIALIMDQIRDYSEEDRGSLFADIHTYCPDLIHEDKLLITSEDDLKLVLFGIDERFYTTSRSGAKRIANSVVNIPVRAAA